MGADDTAAETNGKTNKWWQLDGRGMHREDWGFYVCPTYSHRAVVSLFVVEGSFDSMPSTVRDRWGPDAVKGTMYHFGHADKKIELGLAGSPMVTGPCCDIGWYLRPAGDKAARDLTLYLDQMVTGPQGLVLAASYPQGATFKIQRCLVNCKSLSRVNSLQSMLNSDGDVYFVDAQGTLFLMLVDETNTNDFAYAGVRVLRDGNRWKGGAGARYKLHSDFSGSGQVSMLLPQPLQGSSPTGAPSTSSPATTPAATPAPTLPAPTPTPVPSACVTFCGKNNLKRQGESCGLHSANKESCLQSYLQADRYQKGWSVPCKWKGKKCRANRSAKVDCQSFACADEFLRLGDQSTSLR